MAVPATVIYFTCYDQLCTALRLRMGEYAQEAPLLAGATARGKAGLCSSDVFVIQHHKKSCLWNNVIR